MGHPRWEAGLRKLRAERAEFLVLFSGYADPLFHLVQVFGESAAAGGGEAVLGAGDAGFEKFVAGDVFGFFEFAGVDAEVAVGGFEDALEVVEAERIVGGEGADDAEADALVDEAIEFGEFGSEGLNFLVVAIFVLGTIVVGTIAGARWFVRRVRRIAGLATVPPCYEKSEEDVKAAEAGGEKGVSPGGGREDGDAAEQHEADTHDGDDGDRE